MLIESVIFAKSVVASISLTVWRIRLFDSPRVSWPHSLAFSLASKIKYTRNIITNFIFSN